MIFFAMLFIGATASVVIANNRTENENANCQYGQCAYQKSNGEYCRNCAQQGSMYCWSHNHQN